MASMQRLPTEILRQIVDYLGHLRDEAIDICRIQEDHFLGDTHNSFRHQELANLRRTCKILADVAAVPLFSTLSVWLERDSLNQLLKYSKHALIRTCIKRLQFGGQRVSPYHWNREPDASRGEVDRHCVPKDLEQLHKWADGKFEGLPFTLRSGGCNVDRPSIISNAKDTIDRLEFQKRMELESLDIGLLSEAFRGLPNLTSLVFEYSNSPPASRKLAQSGFKLDDTCIAWRCHVFQVIMQAASKAKCQPRKIVWQNEFVDEGEGGLPIWALSDITPLLIDHNQMVHLLSNLSVLRLEKIWGDRHNPICRRFEEFDPSQALGHFIELCLQLEELHLDFWEAYSGFTRENLMGKASNAKLRSLTFQSMCIDSFQLALCVTTNKSLERVEVVSIYLTDPQGQTPWMSFLNHVRADCPSSLKHFEVIDRDIQGEYHDDLIQDYIRNELDTESGFLLDYVQGDPDQEPSSQASTEYF